MKLNLSSKFKCCRNRSYQKFDAKLISYRDCGYYFNKRFWERVISSLSKLVIENNKNALNRSFGICREIFNTYVPFKQKFIGSNHYPFMNKMLSKEKMKRTRLTNKFLKNKSDYSEENYFKQQNYCEPLLRKIKKRLLWKFKSWSTDNRAFWRTVKPFFSLKPKQMEKNCWKMKKFMQIIVLLQKLSFFLIS